MNEVEAIKRGVAPVKAQITNSDTPYTITGYAGSALNIYNSDTGTDLIVTITLADNTTLAITVPASSTWSDNLSFFKAVASSGSTTFIIQIKGWALGDK